MTDSLGTFNPFKKSELIMTPLPGYASVSTLKLSGWSFGLTTVLISRLYFFAKSKSLWSWPGHPKTAPKP